MTYLNTINIKAQKTPLDESTNSMLRFKQGDDLSFRLGVFSAPESLASLENVESLHFEIYDIGSYQSPSPRASTLYIQKIVESKDINYDLSLDDWNNSTSQHATFNIGVEESNLEAGEKWLKISAQIEDQKLITISAGWIEIEENFTNYTQAEAIDVEVWKSAALVAKEAAQESAESASASASSASESTESASASATSANASAESALESANTASTSASSALESANSALESATSASSSASSANESAASLSESASSASESATSASASASSATSSATSASTSASTAQTAATNASTSATSAATSASTASSKASEAATSATSASTSATNASTSATSASTSAAEAAASAATIATTASLAKRAQSRGELYFPNNTCAYSSGNVIDFYNFTIAFNFKDTNTSTPPYIFPVTLCSSWASNTSTLIGLFINKQYSYSRIQMRYTVDGTTYENYRYLSSAAYALLIDGNYHNIVMICRGSKQNENLTYSADIDLYIDGELSSTSTTSKAAPLPTSDTCYVFMNSSWNQYINTSVCNIKTLISDMKIFNFGLPANDEADTDGVGYTVQDYYNGLDVPVLLQYEDAEKRCIYNIENYTYTVGSTQYVAASIGNNLTCYTGSSATNSPKGTHDNAEKVRSDLTISNS